MSHGKDTYDERGVILQYRDDVHTTKTTVHTIMYH
jgi:hypothetical protein